MNDLAGWILTARGEQETVRYRGEAGKSLMYTVIIAFNSRRACPSSLKCSVCARYRSIAQKR